MIPGIGELHRAKSIMGAIPDPARMARHAQELRWAALLVAATPAARERPVTWQAKALNMAPKDWRRHRKGVVAGSTFARILAVIDRMSAPDFDDAAFDALEIM